MKNNREANIVWKKKEKKGGSNEGRKKYKEKKEEREKVKWSFVLFHAISLAIVT